MPSRTTEEVARRSYPRVESGRRLGAVRGTAVVVVAFLAVVAAGCGTTKTVTRTVTVSATAKLGVGPPGQMVQFGHIKSLSRKGSGYVMRFVPEWFRTGVTATTAAADDGVVSRGERVRTDNYRLD